MQLEMTTMNRQIWTESSQLLKVVTAVDWEQAEDNEIQEAMTKLMGWLKKGTEIRRDFYNFSRTVSGWLKWFSQPGSEYD